MFDDNGTTIRSYFPLVPPPNGTKFLRPAHRRGRIRVYSARVRGPNDRPSRIVSALAFVYSPSWPRLPYIPLYLVELLSRPDCNTEHFCRAARLPNRPMHRRFPFFLCLFFFLFFYSLLFSDLSVAVVFFSSEHKSTGVLQG